MINYRPEIDGLRAIAVLPVIFFHAGFSTLPGGFVGVDVFFVISGYLITGIILREHEEGRFSILNFYERRARRILPALFFVLGATCLYSWYWLLPSDFKGLAQSAVATMLYASNLLFWKTAGYFDTSAEYKPLLHTWSLAVEEQFYLFFPLILTAICTWNKKRIGIVLSILIAASLVVAEVTVRHDQSSAFYLLHTRGWELLAGSLCAVYLAQGEAGRFSPFARELFSITGAVALGGSFLLLNKTLPLPGLYTAFPVAGAVLIILFADSSTAMGKVLRWKLVTHIGLISYSAYLWHQPVFALARHRSLHEPTAGLMAFLCAASLILAHFTWRYIETPFRDRKRFTQHFIFSASIAVSALFIAAGLFVHILNGIPSRFDELTVKLQEHGVATFSSRIEPCVNRFRETPRIQAACSLGPGHLSPSFAIVGDSHAAALAKELGDAATRHRISGRNFTFKGCPPLFRFGLVKPERDDEVCEHLRKDFFSKLSSRDVPQTLVVHARWSQLMEQSRYNNGEGGIESGPTWTWTVPGGDQGYRAGMQAALIESVQRMLRSGRRVILVYPVPEMGWQVPTQLAKSNLLDPPLRPGSASTSHANFLKRSKNAIEALDQIGEHPRLHRIYPSKLFCETVVKNRCIAHDASNPIYFDDDHLSDYGARKVVSQIMVILKAHSDEGIRAVAQ